MDLSGSKTAYLGFILIIAAHMLVGLTDAQALKDKDFLAIFQTISKSENTFMPVLFSLGLSILCVLDHQVYDFARE